MACKYVPSKYAIIICEHIISSHFHYTQTHKHTHTIAFSSALYCLCCCSWQPRCTEPGDVSLFLHFFFLWCQCFHFGWLRLSTVTLFCCWCLHSHIYNMWYNNRICNVFGIIKRACTDSWVQYRHTYIAPFYSYWSKFASIGRISWVAAYHQSNR